MKEQYLGDINDFRKLALLRRLSAGGRIKIGVCWLLTPPDDTGDGQKTEYLTRGDRWRSLDPELYDAIKEVASKTTSRRIPLLEAKRLLPAALYFEEYVPRRPKLRDAFFLVMLEEMATAGLFFFDPDNGLDVRSHPRGRAASTKYVYRDELQRTFAAQHSILVYQHYRREDHMTMLRSLVSDLSSVLDGARVVAFDAQDIAFLLAIHPRHEPTLGTIADKCTDGWPKDFMAIVESPS